MTKVLTGAASVHPLPSQGFLVKKVSKWDGKDAEPIIEEDYDYGDDDDDEDVHARGDL